MINRDEIILQWLKSVMVIQILFLITDFSAMNLNLNMNLTDMSFWIVTQPIKMGFNAESESGELVELLILQCLLFLTDKNAIFIDERILTSLKEIPNYNPI